jgi:hypothetical protein
LDVLHPHCTVAHALPACIRSHGRVGKQNEQQLENLFHPLQRVSGRFAGTDLPFAMQMYSVLVAAFNSNYSPNYAKNQKRNASSDKVLKLLNGYQPLAPVLPMELLHDTSRVSQKLRNITSILQAHKDSGNIGGGVFDDMILFYPSDADEATIANLVAIGKQARKVAAQWTAAPQQLSLDWKAHTVKLDQHHISLALLLCLADTTTKDAMWKALTNPPTVAGKQQFEVRGHLEETKARSIVHAMVAADVLDDAVFDLKLLKKAVEMAGIDPVKWPKGKKARKQLEWSKCLCRHGTNWMQFHEDDSASDDDGSDSDGDMQTLSNSDDD